MSAISANPAIDCRTAESPALSAPRPLDGRRLRACRVPRPGEQQRREEIGIERLVGADFVGAGKVHVLEASQGLDGAILGAGDDAEFLAFDVPGDLCHLERLEAEVEVGVERPRCRQQEALEPLRPDCTGTSVVSPSAIAPFEGDSGDRESLQVRNVGLERRRGVEAGVGHRRDRLEGVDRGGEDVPAVEVTRITEKPDPGPGPADRCGHQRRFLRSRSGLLVERSGTNGSVANGVVRQPGASG